MSTPTPPANFSATLELERFQRLWYLLPHCLARGVTLKKADIRGLRTEARGYDGFVELAAVFFVGWGWGRLVFYLGPPPTHDSYPLNVLMEFFEMYFALFGTSEESRIRLGNALSGCAPYLLLSVVPGRFAVVLRRKEAIEHFIAVYLKETETRRGTPFSVSYNQDGDHRWFSACARVSWVEYLQNYPHSAVLVDLESIFLEEGQARNKEFLAATKAILSDGHAKRKRSEVDLRGASAKAWRDNADRKAGEDMRLGRQTFKQLLGLVSRRPNLIQLNNIVDAFCHLLDEDEGLASEEPVTFARLEMFRRIAHGVTCSATESDLLESEEFLVPREVFDSPGQKVTVPLLSDLDTQLWGCSPNEPVVKDYP
jgi:hypothetical protein